MSTSSLGFLSSLSWGHFLTFGRHPSVSLVFTLFSNTNFRQRHAEASGQSCWCYKHAILHVLLFLASQRLWQKDILSATSETTDKKQGITKVVQKSLRKSHRSHWIDDWLCKNEIRKSRRIGSQASFQDKHDLSSNLEYQSFLSLNTITLEDTLTASDTCCQHAVSCRERRSRLVTMIRYLIAFWDK